MRPSLAADINRLSSLGDTLVLGLASSDVNFGRWIQLNNAVVPCVCTDQGVLVPLQVIQTVADLCVDVDADARRHHSDDATAMKTFESTTAQLACLNEMCQEAGLQFQFLGNTTLVELVELLSVASERDQLYLVKSLPGTRPFESVEVTHNSGHMDEANTADAETANTGGVVIPPGCHGANPHHHSNHVHHEHSNGAKEQEDISHPTPEEHVRWSPPVSVAPIHQMAVKCEPKEDTTGSTSVKMLSSHRGKERGVHKRKSKKPKGRLQIWTASSVSLTAGGAMTVKSSTPAVVSAAQATATDVMMTSSPARSPPTDVTIKREIGADADRKMYPTTDHMESWTAQYHSHPIESRTGASQSIDPRADFEAADGATWMSDDVIMPCSASHIVTARRSCDVKFYGHVTTCLVCDQEECYVSLENLWRTYFEADATQAQLQWYLEREKHVQLSTVIVPPNVALSAQSLGATYVKLRDVARYMDEMKAYFAQENAILDLSWRSQLRLSNISPASDFGHGYHGYNRDSDVIGTESDQEAPLDLSCKRAASV